MDLDKEILKCKADRTVFTATRSALHFKISLILIHAYSRVLNFGWLIFERMFFGFFFFETRENYVPRK